MIAAVGIEPLGFDLRLVKHHYDAQHLFVVLVIAQRTRIRLKERHVTRRREVLAEFVDVDGLVVVFDLFEIKLFAGNEGFDRIVRSDLDAGTVHPTLILVNERQRLIRIVEQHVKHRVFKDQIGLEQYRVLSTEKFIRQIQRVNVVRLVIDRIVNEHNRRPHVERCNVIDELLPFVAHDYDDLRQMFFIELP